MTILLRSFSKKIALYASSSVNRGGTGVYTRRLIDGFLEADINCVIPIGVKQSGFAGKLISEHFTIPQMVKNQGFDLLHLPAFGGRVVKGIPYVVTVHDMAFMARPDWFPALRSIYYRLHFPHVARGASAIIADSDFTVSEIKKYLGIDAYRVYLSAPENTANENLFRTTYGIKGNFILSTSTIEPRKNISALLMAWSDIRRVHKNLTLVIAGRWGWGNKATKHALVNTPGVLWVGSISDQYLKSAFKGARLLVYPSLYEGFGLPPLEASVSGLPFVIGPSKTLQEIFGTVAAGTSGKESESITQTVLDALDKPVNSEELREFAGKFTNANLARNTLKIYEKIFA